MSAAGAVLLAAGPHGQLTVCVAPSGHVAASVRAVCEYLGATVTAIPFDAFRVVHFLNATRLEDACDAVAGRRRPGITGARDQRVRSGRPAVSPLEASASCQPKSSPRRR